MGWSESGAIGASGPILGGTAAGSLAGRVKRSFTGSDGPIGMSRMRVPMKSRLAKTTVLDSQSAARFAAALSTRLKMSPT
jgi:hypothetical protein